MTHRQLVIEPRIDAAVTGEAQVHRSQLADPQGAEVVFDALAQLGRVDVIDSGGNRGPEHADGRCPVRWRPRR